MSERPCIAMLTDFGDRDAYVGIMKGVIAGICPAARVIDLTHGVPAQDAREGAWQLLSAYAHFPADTVFLCVVDPQVGTQRKALGVRAGNYTFIGPDNGLMAWAMTAAAGEAMPTAHVLENPDYRLPDVSATFHGRDVFAPAAAHCAAGVPLAAFGPAVEGWETLEFPQVESSQPGVLVGSVVHVDRFGNIVTNIAREALDAMRAADPTKPVVLQFRGAHIENIVTAYADAPAGEIIALFGSTGYLELAINGGNAQHRFNATIGEAITVYQS